jgi:hypothetical protein
MSADHLGKYNFSGAFTTKHGTNYAAYTNQDKIFYTPIAISDHQFETISKFYEGGIEYCGIYSTFFSLVLSCGVKIAEIDVRIKEGFPASTDSVLTLSDPNSTGIPFTIPLSLSDGVLISVLADLPIYLGSGSESMTLKVDEIEAKDTDLLIYIAEEVGSCEDYLKGIKETLIDKS